MHMPDLIKYSAKNLKNLSADFNIILGGNSLHASWMHFIHFYVDLDTGAKDKPLQESPLCVYVETGLSYHSVRPNNKLDLQLAGL